MKVFRNGRRVEVETWRSVNAGRVLSARPRVHASARPPAAGWTLIELVITMTVLTILTLGAIPLVKTSVRRQKEQHLREVLREMRSAIDEFKRDTVGMTCTPGGGAAIQQVPNTPPIPGAPGPQGQAYIDPRSRVVMADCKLFGVDNPDRYPPDLQTLVDGVDVVPRQNLAGAMPGAGLDSVGGSATENSGGLIPKKKRYLREIPIDPITGERDWCVLSSQEPPDQGCSSSPANIFDVRSKARGESLNGEKYSDW
jgi:general secretion pathway protein G